METQNETNGNGLFIQSQETLSVQVWEILKELKTK
jgi:hypothetical protein